MKLFKYLDDKKGIAEIYKIYKAVQDLKPYAIAKYKAWWEDALDESFFHILENYDSSKGDLENYTTRVVGTIYLNKNRREVASNDTALLMLDMQEVGDYEIPEEVVFEEDKSKDVEKCIAEIIPFFIQDFKFFISNSQKDRKLDYGSILSRYTYGTVNSAKNYLIENYSDSVAKIVDLSKNLSLKNFADDRYLKSWDSGLMYKGTLNGIVIVRRSRGSHVKKLFKLSLKRLIDLIIKLFYDNEEYGKAVIENLNVYVSISGNVVVGERNLRSCLERELVGSVLSRTSLRVVHYSKGREIIFSSTKDSQHDVILPMFGKDLAVSFERIVSKEVI